VRRCLVTGATGFVGPHLTARLAAAGHEVWTTDRTAGATGERHIRADLLDMDATAALVEAARPDWIFHLAGLSSVAYSFAHPQEVLHANLTGACNLFEAMRAAAPRARVVVVGSAEEYGAVEPGRQPIQESEPLRPQSPYAVSKAAQEMLALQYASSHGLDVVLVRSFNHSGPGQSDRFVLPGFARQIAAIERGLQAPLLRVGNLDVWRDFLDVRDVVRAYALLAEHATPGTAYNVCRGNASRIGDLLDGLVGLARVPLRSEVDPERWRPSDLPVLSGDATRLHSCTGWKPEYAIKTTLDDILADWRARLAAEAAS
jgi:GDP-4-dehydro-6-deoxy-D-mannose reductase